MAGLVAAGIAVFDAAIASVVLTTVTRLLAVRFGWSLPEQRAPVVGRQPEPGTKRTHMDAQVGER